MITEREKRQRNRGSSHYSGRSVLHRVQMSSGAHRAEVQLVPGPLSQR